MTHDVDDINTHLVYLLTHLLLKCDLKEDLKEHLNDYLDMLEEEYRCLNSGISGNYLGAYMVEKERDIHALFIQAINETLSQN